MTPGEASKKGGVLSVDGYECDHVFDVEGGLAIIAAGWADEYPGSGNPCHFVPGDFEEFAPGVWIALNANEDGDSYVRQAPASIVQQGPREKARQVLEQSLLIEIPSN